jgi:hypothetical protein
VLGIAGDAAGDPARGIPVSVGDSTTKTIAKIVAAGLVSLAALQSAHAGGCIADNIIKPVAGNHAAREADKIHEQVGKPLDKVVPVLRERIFGGGKLPRI